jgi:hypothetical protein
MEPRTRIRKSLVLIVAVLAIVLLGAIAAITSSRSRPALQEAKLSDGRIVQVAGVTIGPPHSMHTPGLRNALYHFMPAAFKRQLGPSFSAGFGFQHQGIGLWLMCYDPALEQYVPSPFSRAVIVDEHGCEMESTGSGGTSDSFHHASVLHVSNFPRDREKLTFRLYNNFSGTNALGEITIDNPLKAQRADWRPQHLPIVVTNQNVSAKLNRIPPEKSGTDLEIFENGVPSKEWSLENMFFEDTLGNATTTGSNLCQEQNAWKLKIRLMRTPFASFAPNEVWKIGELKLPAAGKSFQMSRSNSVAGVPLILQCINGPGSHVFSNGVCTSSSPWTNGMRETFWVSGMRKQGKQVSLTTRASDDVTIVVTHDSLYPNRQFMMRVHHNDRVVAAARGASSDGVAYYYDLSWLVPPADIPPAYAPLHAEIIVQEGREFEFLVNPKDYQPSQTAR